MRRAEISPRRHFQAAQRQQVLTLHAEALQAELALALATLQEISQLPGAFGGRDEGALIANSHLRTRRAALEQLQRQHQAATRPAP